MSKVYVKYLGYRGSLWRDPEGDLIWAAKNGATRRELRVVLTEKSAYNHDGFSVEGRVVVKDYNTRSYIFINPCESQNNDVIGIAVNGEYSLTLVEGSEIYRRESVGGYGNSCSVMTICKVGTVYRANTYKNRRTATYFKLTHDGWIEVMDAEEPQEVLEIE